VRRRAQLIKVAKDLFGHIIVQNEAAVISTGVGVFVGSNKRDPVMGLYRLSFTELYVVVGIV